MTAGALPPERPRLRHELARKALHVTAVMIPVAYARGASRETVGTVLAVASGVALVIEAARRMSAPFGAMFDRRFGALLRQREKTAFTGATWLALSCFGAVLLFSRDAAIASLWCVTVGDPAAAIAGRAWKTAHPPAYGMDNRKSFIGSLACAAASFVGVWVLADYAVSAALIVAFVAAAAEVLPVRLDDNIRVAGAAGAMAQLLA
jgi:dolichol kinase